MAHAADNQIFGVIAQFDNTDDLIAAAHAAREAGYKEMDAYTPMPVHGVYEAMGYKRSILAWLVFCAGLTGFCTGLGLQYWVSVMEYPVIVGGRPFFSWPSFIPVCFELTILFSALTAVFGMFTLNGLPRPHHPIFEAENFERATVDRFFLCVEATDRKFDEAGVTSFFQSLPGQPENVSTVHP